MILHYVILGLLQGLTEFLPVSSSGHLVIMEKVLGMHGEEVAIAVILHLGTLLSLLVFFFKDLLGLLGKPKVLFYLAVTTVITGVIGLAGKDFFESLFSSPFLVALALLATGALLISTKKFASPKRPDVGLKDAVILGFTQAVAIIPGISRAGTTISTLLLRGIGKDEAFRFSFLIAIPAILAAAFLESRNINFAFGDNGAGLATGFFCSFIAGLVSLRFLKLVLNKAKFHYFGYYCVAVAVATILFVR